VIELLFKLIFFTIILSTKAHGDDSLTLSDADIKIIERQITQHHQQFYPKMKVKVSLHRFGKLQLQENTKWSGAKEKKYIVSLKYDLYVNQMHMHCIYIGIPTEKSESCEVDFSVTIIEKEEPPKEFST
jgi:hypothetical protein